jgi:hypothetical protein
MLETSFSVEVCLVTTSCSCFETRSLYKTGSFVSQRGSVGQRTRAQASRTLEVDTRIIYSPGSL